MNVQQNPLELGFAIAGIATGQQVVHSPPALIVPRSALTITGEVKYYAVTVGSGNLVNRGFCPHCGSRLFSSPANPDIISIQAGSPDDPSWFKPQAEIYVASAQPWDYLNPALPKFAKLPPNNAVATD